MEENLVLVKATDLVSLIDEVKALREEVRQLRSQEDLKGYSIQAVAALLDLHYSSVRKLVIEKKLFAVYLTEDKGKCTIPAWSIKEYLKPKEGGTNGTR